jgi:hypothetical protein
MLTYLVNNVQSRLESVESLNVIKLRRTIGEDTDTAVAVTRSRDDGAMKGG